LEEWKEQIDNFLWPVSKAKKLGLIHADYYGDIILNLILKIEYILEKFLLQVKMIFIMDIILI
jgi:hypothetical protein